MRLCIRSLHSENLPDIRDDILTQNKNSSRCSNAVMSCRHRFRTEQEDSRTTSTKARTRFLYKISIISIEIPRLSVTAAGTT